MLRPFAFTFAAELGDLLQGLSLLGRRAADLLSEDRRAHAASAGGVQAVLHGDVVVDHDRLDLDALTAGELGGHLEVHHVARVVLDDVDDAGAAVDRLRRIDHLIRRRRGEHLSGTGGVEHAHPDEAAVHRLVPRAASRNEGHLALDRGVGPDDVVGVEVDPKRSG